jgi:hypothetical protein
MSQARLDILGGPDRRAVWGRKDEEYIADFCLISRHNLDDFEYKIFRFHFILGADWRLCCRQLKMDKGVFFHAVYRIQQKLGRAFREVSRCFRSPNISGAWFAGICRRNREACCVCRSRRSAAP